MQSPDRPSFVGYKRKINDIDSEDDDDDYRPAYGFRGFATPTISSPSPPMTGNENKASWMNARTASNVQDRGTKSGTAMGANSFAARMMSKMGYVEGQGLGSSGQGILNPVESVSRPQGVGLGAVREKSQQAKDEAKREAARRGEILENSSDEERKKRQRRKEDRRRDGSGTSTPKGPAKPRYRTAREIEADTAGLEVPNILKSLIDATGKEQKLLTSTAGLMTPLEFVSANESESLKIARRARNDLEAFADEWRGLSERKKFVELEEAQVMDEIDAHQSKIEGLVALTSAVEALENVSLIDDLSAKWDEATQRLEALESDFQNLIDEYRLSEVAVATIHPLMRQSVEDWDPLTNPTYLVPNLRRLQHLLSRKSGEEGRRKQSTTSYETMMYTLWLPRVRSAILNEWDVHEPTPATSLVEAWKDLLPGFIFANLLDQVIVPKLSNAIKEWKPRSGKRHNGSSQRISRFPWWLFNWFQYLDEHHTDPKSPAGLLSDVKRKFRIVLDTLDISVGLIGGIELWKDALGLEFDAALRTHLLPRLARHLREEFDVNPRDQDLTALEDVLKWKSFFKPPVLGLLLSVEFFPKWQSVLHFWLTSDPNYEEVGQWFSWWKTQIPEEINALAIVADEWDRGLEMMNLALDLGDRAKTDLPPPISKDEQGHVREHNKKPAATANGILTKPRPRAIQEATFKDVVEEWCADEGLIMIPLHEAHVQSGLPLFRITASANGRGGLLVYLKGDVVWAQNRKMRDVWEPVGLDSSLIARAEGRCIN